MNLLVPSPLEQFEIISLIPFTVGSLNYSFTNSTLFMAIASFIALVWISLSFYKSLLIPSY